MSRVKINKADVAVIEQIRHQLGMTQEQFAEKAGITSRAYQDIVYGKTKSINEQLYEFLKPFGINDGKQDRIVFRQKIINVMNKYGLSHQQLADATNMKKTRISYLLDVNKSLPTMKQLRKLADAISNTLLKNISEELGIFDE